MKKITWEDFGKMYEDFSNTFGENFGELLNNVSVNYCFSDIEDIEDLYNITLGFLSTKEKFNDFVKKWEIQ